MRSSDVIIIGAGVIGLSLALELQRRGVSALVVERGEPGREASQAAGGMIADHDPHLPSELKRLASLSASLYPEFVHGLRDESGLTIDLREEGTIAFLEGSIAGGLEPGVRPLSPAQVSELEPALEATHDHAYFFPERCVDPRHLVAALVKTAHHRSLDLVTGSMVQEVTCEHGRATGVRTSRAVYHSATVVNCAGAWAPQIAPLAIPTRPVKGHMLSLVFPDHPAGTAAQSAAPLVRHVVRSRWCYLVPRSDGRIVVGSTVEPAGFDKTVNTYRVQRLHQAAANLVPQLGEARMNEAWTGLRPGTPDNLPVIGETSIPGYFACTGHYRDGILLAPATAKLVADCLVSGSLPELLSPFQPARFGI